MNRKGKKEKNMSMNQSLLAFAKANKINLMTWKELIGHMENTYGLNINSDEKFCLTEIIAYITHIYKIKGEKE